MKKEDMSFWFNKAQKAFISFYDEEFLEFITLTRRPFPLAILMILVYNLQILSMASSPGQQNQFFNNDKLMWIMNKIALQFKGWNVFENISSSESLYNYAIIVETALNSFLYIFIMTGIATFSLKNGKQIIKTHNFFKIGKIVSCVLFSVYPFWLNMPFQHTNFKMLISNSESINYQILGLVNIPLSFGITWVGIEHDYTYGFKNQDLLSRKKSIRFILSLIMESIMCMISQLEVKWNLFAFGLLIHSRIIYYLYQDCYYQLQASKINFCLQLNTWTFWLGCIIFNINSNHSSINVSLIIVTLVPLQILISNFLIEKNKLKYVKLGLSSDPNELNPFQVEKYCRFLYEFMDIDRLEYMKKKKGLIIEQVFLSHTLSCKLKKCFCKEYTIEKSESDDSNSAQNKDYCNIYVKFHGPLSLDDKEERFQFLGFLILSIYQKVFSIQSFQQKKVSHISDLKLSYLYFITEVMQIPTKAFVEILETQKQLMNFKNKMKSMIEVKQLIKNAKTTFQGYWKKSEIQNQRLNMMSIIEFSDLSLSVFKNLKVALILKKEILITLNNEFVDLKTLNHKGQNYLQIKDQIQKDIQSLFDINPHSDPLKSFAQVYSDNFDIKKRSYFSYVKQSKLKMLKNLKKEDLGINLFSARSTMVYISLLHPIGIIKRISSSVEQIFGKKMEEVVGKSCNFMMPDAIAGIHDECLDLFVEKGNLHNLKKGIIFGFGKNKNGFMFAVHARTKLIQEKLVDFGVVGIFEEINTNYDYFLTSANGILIDSTERIFSNCFSQFQKSEKKKIEGLDICKIIPYLGHCIHTLKMPLSDYDTLLMCVPTSNEMMEWYKKDSVYNKRHSIQEILNKCRNINSFKYFEVVIRFEQIDTAVDVSVKFIEFIKMKRIKREEEIMDSIIQFKLKMEKLLNQKYEIKFNSSINLNSPTNRQGKTKTQNSFFKSKISLEDQDGGEITNRLGKETKTDIILKNEQDLQNKLATTNQTLQMESQYLSTGRLSIKKEGSDEENFHFKDESTKANLNLSSLNLIKKQSQKNEYSETSEVIKKHPDQYCEEGKKYELSLKNFTKSKDETHQIIYDDQHSNSNLNDFHLKNITSFSTKFEEYETKIPYDLNFYENNMIDKLSERRKMIEEKSQSKDLQTMLSLNSPMSQIQSPCNIFSIGSFINQSNNSERLLPYFPKSSIQNKNVQKTKGFQQNFVMKDEKNQQTFYNQDYSHLSLQQKKHNQKRRKIEKTSHFFKQLSYDNKGDCNDNEIGSESIKQTQFNQNNEEKTEPQCQSSIGSQGSNIQKQKKAMIEVVFNQYIPSSAQNLIKLGYFLGFLILFIYTLQFVMIIQYSDNLLESQKSEQNIPSFINDFSQIVMNTELLRFFSQQIDINYWDNLQNENLFAASRSHLSDFKQGFANFLVQSQFTSSMSYLNTATINLQEFSYELGPHKISRSLIQGVQMLFFNLYSYSQDSKDNLPIQSTINENYFPFLIQVYNFYVNQQEEAVYQLEKSSSQQLIFFIIIILLSFLSILITFPVYLVMQSKKEEILKLICTFPPEKLALYLSQTEDQIQDYQKNMNNSIKNNNDLNTENKINQNILKLPKKNVILLKSKKKTISETTSLKKISIPLLILLLMILISLLLQPTFVFVFGEIYISKFFENLKTLFIIGKSEINMSCHFGLFFTILNLRRIREYEDYPQYFYSKFSDDLDQNFNAAVQFSFKMQVEFQSLQQRIQDNASLSKGDRDAFLQILVDDMCQVIPQYQNYLQDKLDLDSKNEILCSVPKFNEILRRGLILSFHEFWNLFQIAQPILSTSSSIEFDQQILDFHLKYSFVQMRKAYDNIKLAGNIISNILFRDISNNIDYFQHDIIVLFLVQLSILIIAYSMLWSSIQHSSQRSFFKIKKILSIFSIDQILENSYITNYLSQQIKLHQKN